LQRINVARWHPRQLPKTSESVEQQRFSADTISQWSQACIDADTIVGHPVLGNQPIGQLYASNILYEAYKNYCKHHPASNVVFGKALTQMFGSPTRQNVGGSGTARPRTYGVPDADTWQLALDRRLGIGAGR
jgi:hypothetical protein